MAKLTADDARDVARSFLDASSALGTYRFEHWKALTKAQRQALEDAAWDLLNYSTSFTTTAVGLALDDLERDLKEITTATARARRAIEKIENVKHVIAIAAAFVQLGGAIASQHPGAIVKAAGGLADAAKG